MNNGIKTIIYVVVTFLIIWLVFGFLVTVLPWLILAGVIIYFGVKIKGAILNKRASKNNQNETTYTETTYTEANSGEYNSEIFEASSIDNNTSVIDVDYKEVE